MCLVLLLLLIHNIETHKLNHTDLEPRYQGEGPFSPTWERFLQDGLVNYFIDRYDESVQTFYHINYCQPREPCKRQFREEFMCRLGFKEAERDFSPALLQMYKSKDVCQSGQILWCILSDRNYGCCLDPTKNYRVRLIWKLGFMIN